MLQCSAKVHVAVQCTSTCCSAVPPVPVYWAEWSSSTEIRCYDRSMFTARVNTAHCTLHTDIYTLHTAHYIHTVHWSLTLYTAHYILPTAHSRLHTENCTLMPAHFTLPTLHSTLHTLTCKLYTAHSTLHTLHCTMYTAHYHLLPMCSKQGGCWSLPTDY